MSKFILKISVFLSPIFLWLIIEALLPLTTFTHRHFEALSFQSKVIREYAWYPNIESTMLAEGDLCHHTSNSIKKEEYWKTDKLGFRNDNFIQSPDILIIGDSFIQGSSLSQEQTITNTLISKLKNKLTVYNMAPSSMSQFNRLLKRKVIKKPKILIYSIVERHIPSYIKIINYTSVSKIKTFIKKVFGIYNFNVYVDKALKNLSLKWMKARVFGKVGNGVQSLNGSNMYFLSGTSQKYCEQSLHQTYNVIKTYKSYCDSLAIDFIFLPMPDKETVYYDYVPLAKQNQYLFQLDSLLKSSNIKTINTLKIYTDYRKVHQKLLYHIDDTHWNKNATELISIEILNTIDGF